jgi:hypothetical protein
MKSSEEPGAPPDMAARVMTYAKALMPSEARAGTPGPIPRDLSFVMPGLVPGIHV